jgi:hypothetical protein
MIVVHKHRYYADPAAASMWPVGESVGLVLVWIFEPVWFVYNILYVFVLQPFRILYRRFPPVRWFVHFCSTIFRMYLVVQMLFLGFACVRIANGLFCIRICDFADFVQTRPLHNHFAGMMLHLVGAT